MPIGRGYVVPARWESPDRHVLYGAIDHPVRIARIIARLLLLAKAERPDFVRRQPIEVETFLEDVFVRWSDVTDRGWRLGPLAPGTLLADEVRLRTDLEALLVNAVKYTEPRQPI